MSEVISAKQAHVLSAAVLTFGRYGYRRTSMDLLAQAADVSRPALYQYFRNKEDVFRAVVSQMTDGLLAAAQLAAEAEGSVADRLHGVLSVKTEFVSGTVDPAFRGEIVKDAERICGDLLTSFSDRQIEILELLLHDARNELRLVGDTFSAHDVAQVLHASVNGLIQEQVDPAVLDKRLHDLVTLVVRGLTPH